MLISRTPFRISFVGGGTDIPDFYRENGGGAVLSMSIRYYFYLTIHEYFYRDSFLIKYSKTEKVSNVSEIKHRIIRQVFSDYDMKGVDFSSAADFPAGTGLGSSSAFTVSLITLCNAYGWKYEPKMTIAEKACAVEIEKLGEPIGKQDQYACALGGMNLLRFSPDDTVSAAPIFLDFENRRRLEQNLLLFYIGNPRSASEILRRQKEAMRNESRVLADMTYMAEQAARLKDDLLRDVDLLGDYLDEGWQRKRRLAPGITSPKIDEIYASAVGRGASGGKVLGAGGGGFLLLYVKPEAQSAVREALRGLPLYPVALDVDGTTIIYDDRVA